MFYATLPNRAVLEISGEDKETFLQGIITNDIGHLKPGAPLYAAILTPQGKYLFDFLLYRRGEAILMDYDNAQKEALIKKLTMYRLRSKVAFRDLADGVTAFWGEGTPPEGAEKDPRHHKLGYRLLAERPSLADAHEAGDYDYHRLSCGIPETGRDLVPEKSFPLPMNMEELNAIDYNKGCYVGQEVTARSKHRGVIRKALYVLRTPAESLPEPFLPLLQDGRAVGEVLSGSQDLCLAQIEKEAAEKSEPFTAGGITLTLA